MIKKISQLDPLNNALSVGREEPYVKLVLDDETCDAAKDATLFEASFANNVDDETIYYTSHQCTLTDLEHYTGIDWMRDLLSQLTGTKFIISNDLWIGMPGLATSDGVDDYYPNNTTGLSVFSRSEFHNDSEFHGSMAVHGPASFAKIIHGVAYRAQWGDLGEYYETDSEYEPGTLLQFGGTAEMTIAKTDVNGIVSTEPGFILNGKSNGTTIVAVCGKVPVKTIGPVKKFDKIVLSEVAGVGVAKPSEDRIRKTIAVALESSDDPGIKNVLCTTRLVLD